MMILSTLGSSAQSMKDDLLKVDLKNPQQVSEYQKKLEQKLKSNQISSEDYKQFIGKLKELTNKIGEHAKTDGIKTTYKKVVVNESTLTFDLTNPESKAKLDQVIENAKKFKGTFIVSIDTLKQMIHSVAPVEEVKLNENVKFSNQAFKGYNEFKANDQIVDSIANQIIKTFEGYKNIYGYISVKGSASHVPTTAFGGDNLMLAQARSCAFATQLQAKLPDSLKNKVIVDYIVDGPKYENDAKNTSKYEPYQYCNVDIHLNAIKSLPIVNTPEKVIVKVKVLTTVSGVDEKVVQTIFKGAKPTGKGGVQSACPANFDKK